MSTKQPETLQEWIEAYPCMALQPSVVLLINILSKDGHKQDKELHGE